MEVQRVTRLQTLTLVFVTGLGLTALTGCGPEQQSTGGQVNGSTVPVSLALSLPHDAVAASASGRRFWATIRSVFFTPSNAWAATYDLSELTVTVLDSNQHLLTTKTEPIASSHQSGDSIPISLDAPIGADRIFVVSGRDRISSQITLQGTSRPTTLIEGQPVTVAITLTTVNQPALVITTASPLSSGTVNQPYPTTTLTATGGTLPLRWDPVVTPPLPNGLIFDANTATISGTALSASGPTLHTFTVRDSSSPTSQTVTKSLQLTVNSALTIDTTSLPTGIVGVSYTVQLNASGGTPPYNWSILSGDPAPGLTLNASGKISGTPNTVLGSPFTRTYRVTDQTGVTKDAVLTIVIGQQLVITDPPSLSNGVVGTAYSAIVMAVGGTPPYSWTVTPPLPTGLSLTPSGTTATISGVPQAGTAGTTTHTITVRDSSSPTPQSSTKTYSLQVSVPSPIGRVEKIKTATDVSAGGTHTCARLADGTVWCWGENGQGQLANGNTTDSSTPEIINGISKATAVAAGGYHSCARLDNGTVLCWGLGSAGQTGSSLPQSGVVTVSGMTTAIAVAAGGHYSCALLDDGTVRCWGLNSFGQLGNGTTITASSIPVEVKDITPNRPADMIAAGAGHACARLTDQTVHCWGFNERGQLGNGTTTSSSVPVVVSGIKNAITVAAGGRHSCALLDDGTVWCWGGNSEGQLGNGTTDDSSKPVLVSGLNPSVTMIAAGELHTCTLLTDKTVHCWGSNDKGQLGVGGIAKSSVPVPVTGITTATAITTGSHHSCARLEDRTLQCWGDHSSGQLGIGP